MVWGQLKILRDGRSGDGLHVGFSGWARDLVFSPSSLVVDRLEAPTTSVQTTLPLPQVQTEVLIDGNEYMSSFIGTLNICLARCCPVVLVVNIH